MSDVAQTVAELQAELKLPDLELKRDELKQSLEKHLVHDDDDYYKDKKIIYNYGNNKSFESLKTLLLSTYYIEKYNIIAGLVEIICDYIPYDIWSVEDTNNNKDKSEYASVIESNDNSMSYAVSRYKEIENGYWAQTILFDETMTINYNKSIKDKIIYRYIFKYWNTNATHWQMCIGIIKSNALMPLSWNTNDGLIGFEKKDESLGLHLDGIYATFYGSVLPRGHKKRCSCSWTQKNKQKDNNKFDEYFLFEIDLMQNVVRVVCSAFDVVRDMKKEKIKQLSCSIPQKFIKIIQKEGSFRLGLSWVAPFHNPKTSKYFGLGVVRL